MLEGMNMRLMLLALAALLATGTASALADDTAPPQTATFAGGASSSGWIDFTTGTNLGIYVPVNVNGHDVMASLWGGPSSISKSYATSLGLTTNAAGAVRDLDVLVGNLTLHHAAAKASDMVAPAYAPAIVGKPVPFSLGEDVFNQLAVDIDFTNRRIAFRDPTTLTKPEGAIEVPIVERGGQRVVPLSINGATPALFELELGNVSGPLLVIPAYAQAHTLFDGRPTSQRLSGPFSETIVTLDHLSFAGVDFPRVPIAIVPDSEVPPAPITGGVGLPLLSHFRLIIDYSHNRIYALPNLAANATPIPKDRLGIVLAKTATDGDFTVAFVSPKSPAEAAGFTKGEKIALIDGKPFTAWPVADVVKFQMTDTGITHTFTMADGSMRKITSADFF
jgi:hypothetical protein